MIKAVLVGLGACGNSIGIEILRRGLFEQNMVNLINSTSKDIPAEYLDQAILFKGSNGCGKERNIGKQLMLNSLQNDSEFSSKIDSMIDPDVKLVIIVTSTEGGTGSGASVILADYIRTVLKRNVKIFACTGFEDDARGMQNTIEFFQDMKQHYTIEAISNKKYEEAGIERFEAQEKANNDIIEKIMTSIGYNIVYEAAEQVMDPADLYKTATTPGYMISLHVDCSKMKNVEAFNKAIINTIDEDKSLEISTPSIKRLGVIINVSDKSKGFIDYKFTALKQKLGNYFEVFMHKNLYDGGEEYIEFIASGMQLPLDELKEVFESYKNESSQVNKEADSFFAAMSQIRGNSEDSMFNVGLVTSGVEDEDFDNKDSFFNSYAQNKEESPVDFNVLSGETDDKIADIQTKTRDEQQKEKESFFKRNNY